MSQFSDALYAALKTLNISQVAFAGLCKVDQSHVSQWLSGGLKPSRKALQQICSALADTFQKPEVAAEILVAHLRDEAAASSLHPKYYSIAVSGADPSAVNVPSHLRDVFEWLVEGSVYPEVSNQLRTTATLIQHHIAARAGAAKIIEATFPPIASLVAEEPAPYLPTPKSD
jgi:transcriptional regulator with XRE-family HTH domain